MNTPNDHPPRPPVSFSHVQVQNTIPLGMGGQVVLVSHRRIKIDGPFSVGPPLRVKVHLHVYALYIYIHVNRHRVYTLKLLTATHKDWHEAHVFCCQALSQRLR